MIVPLPLPPPSVFIMCPCLCHAIYVHNNHMSRREAKKKNKRKMYFYYIIALLLYFPLLFPYETRRTCSQLFLFFKVSSMLECRTDIYKSLHIIVPIGSPVSRSCKAAKTHFPESCLYGQLFNSLSAQRALQKGNRFWMLVFQREWKEGKGSHSFIIFFNIVPVPHLNWEGKTR